MQPWATNAALFLVTVFVIYLALRLRANERKTMSLSERIDADLTRAETAEAAIETEVAADRAAIADLQAKVDNNTATPEEVARLDALTAKLETVAGIAAPPTP